MSEGARLGPASDTMAVRAQLQTKGGRPRSDCTEREAAAVSGRAAYSWP